MFSRWTAVSGHFCQRSWLYQLQLTDMPTKVNTHGLTNQIHLFHVQYKMEENVNSLPVSWSLLKYRRHFWQRSWPYQLQLSDMHKKNTQIIKDWIYNSDSLVTFTVLNGRKCLSFTMLLEFAEVSKTLLTTFLSFPAPID